MSVSTSVRVYYLASGAIGVPVLEALLADDRVEVVGIGTQPDRPAGRRRVPVPTPVAAAAAARGLSVSRYESVNRRSVLRELANAGVEMVVVASFGQILRQAFLDLPPRGCLNVHASLLPRHRGASPVAAAILAGDRQTGVSFMAMDRGLDTGAVYEAWSLEIGASDTAGELEQRLGDLAGRHLVDCIWKVARLGAVAVPQAEAGASYARRLCKEDGRIDWRHSAVQIERCVRAYLPWPIAFTTVPSRRGEIRVQITGAAVAPASPPGAAAGEVVAASRDGWLVACGEGTLSIERVVPAGRRDMSAEEFLRGIPVPLGTRLGIPACEADIGAQ